MADFTRAPLVNREIKSLYISLLVQLYVNVFWLSLQRSIFSKPLDNSLYRYETQDFLQNILVQTEHNCTGIVTLRARFQHLNKLSAKQRERFNFLNFGGLSINAQVVDIFNRDEKKLSADARSKYCRFRGDKKINKKMRQHAL